MSVPGPVLGPCVPWVAGADVAAFSPLAAGIVGSSTHLLDQVAAEASLALFEVSGRQFNGGCQRAVRPQNNQCQCWGPPSLGLGPWYWSSAAPWGAGTWGWRNECGDRRGCNPQSLVRLAGYPVVEILEVKIDGALMPELDPATGYRNWRLDGWRRLVRMALPGSNGAAGQQRYWPSCQASDLDDNQPGTFSITYLWGQAPPQLGRDAACELAVQLFVAAGHAKAESTVVPAGASVLTRGGVKIERQLLANWFDQQKPTGLVYLDMFLRAYWRTRVHRRGAVHSPDVQGFARAVGTNYTTTDI